MLKLTTDRHEAPARPLCDSRTSCSLIDGDFIFAFENLGIGLQFSIRML